MYISKVRINNFQSFYKKTDLELSKGVVIFIGANDTGKSKLFNVFNWAFFDRIYGKNIHNQKQWHNGVDSYGALICNTRTLSEAKKGEMVEVSVEICFITTVPHNSDNSKANLPNKIYDSEVEYSIIRKIELKFTGGDWTKDENWLKKYKEPFLCFKWKGECFPINDITQEIDDIFPLSLRDYMWFQGETINNLVDFNSSVSLRNAINRISYFPLYEILSGYSKVALEKVQAQVTKIASNNIKISQKYKTAVEDVQYYQKKYFETEMEKGKIEKRISGIKSQIEDDETELLRYQNYPKYQQRYFKLKQSYDAITNQTKTFDEERRIKIIDKWMALGITKSIEDSKEVLDSYEEEIKKASPINNPMPKLLPGDEWVELMLRDSICYVCERHFTEKDKEVLDALNSRYGQGEIDEIKKQLEQYYTELKRRPDDIIKYINAIPKEIMDFNNQINNAWSQKQHVDKEIDALYNEMKKIFGGVDIEAGAKKAENLIERISLLRNELELPEKQLQIKERELRDYKAKLDSAKIAKESQSTPETKSSREDKALPYFEYFERILETLKTDAFHNFIDKIEQESNKLYNTYLSHRKIKGGSLKIDRDTLKLKNYTKAGILRDTNQSNEDIAKISVINTILKLNSDATGENYPFIADAPSSSFDTDTTLAYTWALSDLFDQCIILSKDYNELNLEQLKKSKKISAIYKIEYKPVFPNDPPEQEFSSTFIEKIKQ